MYKSTKDLMRERLATTLRETNKDKKPYLLRGMPDTILYLTPQQAYLRTDILPAF